MNKRHTEEMTTLACNQIISMTAAMCERVMVETLHKVIGEIDKSNSLEELACRVQHAIETMSPPSRLDDDD